MRQKVNKRKGWAMLAVLTAAVFAASFFAACNGDTNVEDLAVFLLNKTSIELTVGGNVEMLELNIANVDAQPKWESSDESVATVTVGSAQNRATVMGVGEGVALITASAGEHSVSCAVIVHPGAYITIENPTINLWKDRTANIEVDTNVKTGLTYRSSNESVATVSSSGLVTAVGGGTAIITVSGGNTSATCTVNVTAPYVTLDKSLLQLTCNDGENTAQLTAESNGTVRWDSADDSVATVDDNGLVTAVAEGETTITATYESAVATCTVKVKGELLSLAISPEEVTLTLENPSAQLTATVTPEQTGDDAAVEWTIVSGGSLIELSDDGLVTRKDLVNYGNAVVRATSVKDPDAYDEVTITCPDPYADWIAISTAAELKNALKAENSNKSMYLTCDIDLDGAQLNSGIDVYSGIFDGRGYEISNYSGTLFNAALTGTVKNLALVTDTSNINEGKIGVICHHFMGNAKVENCRFDVTFVAGGVGTRAVLANHDANGNATVNNVIILVRNPDNRPDTFAGNVQGGSMTNVYYAVYSGNTKAGGATLKTDAELKSADTFDESWDADVWSIADGKIPELQNSGNFGAVSVKLSETSASVVVGDTVTLSATVKPSKLPDEDKAVVWTSSDNSIATVNNGVVTGVKAGEVTITATSVKDGTKSASCSVTVQAYADPVVTITNKASLPEDIEVGTPITLTTEVNQDDGALSWSSSDDSIATVDNNGALTLKAAGEVTITVTFTAHGKSATDSVTLNIYAGAMIELALDARSVAVGGTYKIEPAKAAGGTVAWSSSNTSVATIDADGTVRGVAVGKTTITATIGTATDTMVIAVYEKAAGAIEVSTVEQFLAITGANKYYLVNDIDFAGNEYVQNTFGTMVATIHGQGYALKNLTINLSGQDVGFIDMMGNGFNMQGVNFINMTIKGDAIHGGLMRIMDGNAVIANCYFDVNIEARGIRIAPIGQLNGSSKITNCIFNVRYTGDGVLAGAGNANPRAAIGRQFGASKYEKLFVNSTTLGDASGKVFAVSSGDGNTELMASAFKTEAELKESSLYDESWEEYWVISNGMIPVLKGALVEEPVSVKTDATGTVAVGETITLSVTVKPNYLSDEDKAVVWTSSDSTVATVDNNGVVTGVAAGEVTVTATSVKDNTKSASCVVTVTAFAAPEVSITNKSDIPADVAVGADVTLTAEGNQDGVYSWSSSDDSIASVDSSGTLTLKAAGEVTITVTFTAHGESATDSITINVYAGAKVEIALDRRSVSIGGTYAIDCTILGGTPTWTSSDTSIATVSADGVVTGVAEGVVEITASVAGTEATGTIKIHVFAKEADGVEAYDKDSFINALKSVNERKNIYILCDIDMGGAKLDSGLKGSTYFGTIDGFGYTISNYSGILFHNLSGTVQNLNIVCDDSNVDAHFGAFCHHLNGDGVIKNCSVDFTVSKEWINGIGCFSMGNVDNTIFYIHNPQNMGYVYANTEQANGTWNNVFYVADEAATSATPGATKKTEAELSSPDTFDDTWTGWVIEDGKAPRIKTAFDE